MKARNNHGDGLKVAPQNKISSCRYWINVFLFYAVWITICLLRYGKAANQDQINSNGAADFVNNIDDDYIDQTVNIRQSRSALPSSIDRSNDEYYKARVKFTVVDLDGVYIDENYEDAHATHFQLKTTNEREQKQCLEHQANEENSKKRCARNLVIDYTERYLRQKYGLMRSKSKPLDQRYTRNVQKVQSYPVSNLTTNSRKYRSRIRANTPPKPKKLELISPIEDVYGYLTTIYLNITFNKFDGQGPRTYTLAMKPKPWSTAKGAWYVEYLLNNPNNIPDNSSTTEINPLSPYRVYGGVIKGLEETSSVAIVNRAGGLNGLIQISPTESYMIRRRELEEDDYDMEMVDKNPKSMRIFKKNSDRNNEIQDSSSFDDYESSDEDYDEDDDELYDDESDYYGSYGRYLQHNQKSKSGHQNNPYYSRKSKRRSRRSNLDLENPLDMTAITDSSYMDYEFIKIVNDKNGNPQMHQSADPFRVNLANGYTLEGDDDIDLSDIRDDSFSSSLDSNYDENTGNSDFNDNYEDPSRSGNFGFVDYLDVDDEDVLYSNPDALGSSFNSFETDDLGVIKGAHYGRSKIYNIEICLIADESVVNFHGNRFIDYVHTLMNIVDEAYHHRTLGVKINIVLSKIIKYRVSDPRYHAIIKDDEHRSLKNVLNYMKGLRQYNHFDLGIFLTKTPFGPAAGYAPVDSICKPGKAGVLIADRGMNCAYVIAHEIGHTLGMQHDRHDNACKDSPDQGSIMAPVVKSRISRYQWSRCSRSELMQRLKYHTCIHDMPRNQDLQIKFEKENRAITIDGKRYDGERWSRDAQCSSLYGKEWGTCKTLKARTDVECRSLWCENKHQPRTYCMGFVGAPLHGTACGNANEQWCFNGFCIYKSNRDVSPKAVDGNWQQWSEWDGCSRSCGVGVQYRHRVCSMPKNGGRNLCRGEQYASQLCNTRECLSKTGSKTIIDFRQEQCASLSNRATYKGEHVEWFAGYLPDIEACQLVCAAKPRSGSKRDLINIRMSQPVKDGTRCSYDDPHGICTGGRCVQYGCDYSTNINMKFDRCGRCNGRDENCIHVQKHDIDITRKILSAAKPQKMHKVVQLTPGSRNIEIIYENWRGTRLNLRLKDMNSNRDSAQVFLRPNLRRKRFKDGVSKTYYKVAANALWYYRADRKRIIINAVGPISQQVNAYIRPKMRSKTSPRRRSKTRSARSISQTQTQSRQVRQTTSAQRTKRTFSYEWWYDPLQKPRTDIKNFMWYKHHGPCAVTCGQGYETPILYCIDKQSKRKIPYKFCTSLPKPHRVPRPCHVEKRCEIPPKWVTTGWSQCSKSCGYTGYRERRVYCQRENSDGYLQKISDRICHEEALNKKPSIKESCNHKKCEWRTGQWSPCTRTCGPGQRSRLVQCIVPGNRCTIRQPPSSEACDLGRCPDDPNPDNSEQSTACTVDGSFFCHGNTDYCYVKGYRDLCCKTCANYNPATQSFN